METVFCSWQGTLLQLSGDTGGILPLGASSDYFRGSGGGSAGSSWIKSAVASWRCFNNSVWKQSSSITSPFCFKRERGWVARWFLPFRGQLLTGNSHWILLLLLQKLLCLVAITLPKPWCLLLPSFFWGQSSQTSPRDFSMLNNCKGMATTMQKAIPETSKPKHPPATKQSSSLQQLPPDTSPSRWTRASLWCTTLSQVLAWMLLGIEK